MRELRARPPGTLAAFEGALSDLERRSEGLEGEPGEAVRAGLQGLRDGHFGLVTRLTAAALGGFYAPVPPPPPGGCCRPAAAPWPEQPGRSSVVRQQEALARGGVPAGRRRVKRRERERGTIHSHSLALV